MNLKLRITPFEFRGLITYLQWACRGQQHVPLHQQHLAKLVLIDYLKKWSVERIDGWIHRKTGRIYSLSMPLAVAKALHDEMPHSELVQAQQLFLYALDQAIVNHQPPGGPAMLNP